MLIMQVLACQMPFLTNRNTELAVPPFWAVMPLNWQIAEFAKCMGKAIQMTTNAGMKRAPMHVHKKKYALQES